MECPYCEEQLELTNITIKNWDWSWNSEDTNLILHIRVLKHFHCPYCNQDIIEECIATEEN